MSLIDELNQALADSETNRTAAHAVIDTNFDAIKASIQTAITQISAFSQPTPAAPAVAIPAAA